MKAAYEKGYYYEKAYRGCAQCTLAALADVLGNRNDHLFRQANILAAGMGVLWGRRLRRIFGRAALPGQLRRPPDRAF